MKPSSFLFHVPKNWEFSEKSDKFRLLARASIRLEHEPLILLCESLHINHGRKILKTDHKLFSRLLPCIEVKASVLQTYHFQQINDHRTFISLLKNHEIFKVFFLPKTTVDGGIFYCFALKIMKRP